MSLYAALVFGYNLGDQPHHAYTALEEVLKDESMLVLKHAGDQWSDNDTKAVIGLADSVQHTWGIDLIDPEKVHVTPDSISIFRSILAGKLDAARARQDDDLDPVTIPRLCELGVPKWHLLVCR